MRNHLKLLGAVFLAVIFCGPVFAAGFVSVQDYVHPDRTIVVNADGSINTTPSGASSSTVKIDQTTPGTTNGVVVNSSALPTGAATAANQSTMQTTLSTISTNTTNAGTPTLQSGSTTAVTQATGTNLHTVTDTGSVTSASNFPSTVATGTGSQGATVPRVTVATDSATVAGSATLPAGTNNIGGVNPDNVADGANIAASGAAAGVLTNTPFSTAGYAVVDVNVSTLTATSATPQASFDGGSTYATVGCKTLSGVSSASVISISTTGVYECMAGDHFQLTQVGSGAVTAKIALKRFPTTFSGQLSINGNVASGSADSGSPVKTGGKYNSTPISLSNGNRGDTQLAPNGDTLVEEGGHSFAHISTATTTTVKSGAGYLHTLSVNGLGTVASTTTVYDNTAGSGTVIAVINTLAGQESYVYDVAFATGLTIVTTGTVAPDITVSYR